MSRNTQISGVVYNPAFALICYSRPHAYGVSHYVERRNFDKTGRLMAGEPVSVEVLKQLGKIYTDKQKVLQFKGFIPENILYATDTPRKLIWYKPGGLQQLYFLKEVGKSGKAHIPGLIFVARENNLSVYVSRQKPTAKSELFRAPFLNVNEQGHVCLGSAKKPTTAKSFEELIVQWETAFFRSYFSEIHGDPLMNKEDIVSFWRTMIDTQQKFPYKKLKPIKTKLYQL